MRIFNGMTKVELPDLQCLWNIVARRIIGEREFYLARMDGVNLYVVVNVRGVPLTNAAQGFQTEECFAHGDYDPLILANPESIATRKGRSATRPNRGLETS